jgi:hypothetical protein
MTAHYMGIEGVAREGGERLSVGAQPVFWQGSVRGEPAPVSERKNRVVALTADPHYALGRNGGTNEDEHRRHARLS